MVSEGRTNAAPTRRKNRPVLARRAARTWRNLVRGLIGALGSRVPSFVGVRPRVLLERGREVGGPPAPTGPLPLCSSAAVVAAAEASGSESTEVGFFKRYWLKCVDFADSCVARAQYDRVLLLKMVIDGSCLFLLSPPPLPPR